jgi:hypothetical protein
LAPHGAIVPAIPARPARTDLAHLLVSLGRYGYLETLEMGLIEALALLGLLRRQRRRDHGQGQERQRRRGHRRGHRRGVAQQRIVLPQIHRRDRHLGDDARGRRLSPQRPDGMHAQRRLRVQQLLQRRFHARLALLRRQVQKLHIVLVGPLRTLAVL